MVISVIPLQPVPAQTKAVLLEDQQCVIDLVQLGTRQYMSLSVGGVPICQSVLLVNASPIVRAAYTGFVGEFAVIDTQGDLAPEYTGWGGRWQLVFNPDA